MSKFNAARLNSIDSLLESGKSVEATTVILRVLKDKIPREYVSRLAWQLVRCGLPLRGLKILNPIVRGSHKVQANPTEDEKALYAACLIRVGGNQEALGILESVSPNKVPKSIFYRGLAHLNEWRYRDSIPLFLDYLSAMRLTPYERAVGRLNLAACYVHEHQHDEALTELNTLVKDADLHQWVHLRGTLYELLAQNAVFAKEWKEAEQALRKAEQDLKGTDGNARFFVEKWRTIAEVEKSHASAASLKKISELKAKARKKMHWETLRDCDRVLAVETQNIELLQRVYFGTPYESYRAWITKMFGSKFDPPSEYLWKLGANAKQVIDLNSGEMGLKTGSFGHRVLFALSRDFYRPIRVAPLYTLLYPGEFFEPVSGTHKIHEGIYKFRSWLAKEKWGLEIEEIESQYRFGPGSRCALLLTSDSGVVSSKDAVLEKIRKQWGDKSFSISEAMKLLGMSKRSCQRVLKTGTESGELVREGAAAATVYRFVPLKKVKQAA